MFKDVSRDHFENQFVPQSPSSKCSKICGKEDSFGLILVQIMITPVLFLLGNHAVLRGGEGLQSNVQATGDTRCLITFHTKSSEDETVMYVVMLPHS